MSETKKSGLELLREPFPSHHIGKLAKETSAQKSERTSDKSKGMKCALCNGWHHRNAVHLDYVGHAALTDRLLGADPGWNWEPLAFTEDGLPKFDASGGLWIKLTVDGVTRLGYGHAPESEYKDIGSREKEVIGDALRNAAMRFGAALELWHKGVLHVDEETGEIGNGKQPITARGGARERCSPEDVAEVDRLAGIVLDALDAGDENLAYENFLKGQKALRGNADAQVAYYDRFNSTQRTLFKKLKEAELVATQA